MARSRAGKFYGSYYIRGGAIRDKHGNVYKKPLTYRQKGTGIVLSSSGKWVGREVPRKHYYGNDPRKSRKPSTFVRPNSITALKRRGGHIRRLR